MEGLIVASIRIARALPVCPKIWVMRIGRRTGRLNFEAEPASPPADLRHPFHRFLI
jgi:hypothetical protein